jgi:hypothetical protein
MKGDKVTTMKTKVPKSRRGRRALTDWEAMRIGDCILGNSGSAQYWSKKLAPRRFVVRGAYVWRAQ